jgi:hypothetical protein
MLGRSLRHARREESLVGCRAMSWQWLVVRVAAGVLGTVVLLLAWANSAAAGSAPPRAFAASTQPTLILRNGLDNESPFFSTDGEILGFQVNSRRYPNDYNVEIEDRAGHRTYINAPGTEGFSGGIDGATIVYSEWDGTNERLKLFDLSTGQRTDIPALDTATTAHDYHPTISGPWILFTRADSPRWSKVLLFNRISGELRTLGSISAHRGGTFVYSGQVAGNYAVWGRATASSDDVFRYQIDTRTNTLLRRPRGVFGRYNPAVTAAGTAYWEQQSSACRPQVQIARETRGGRLRILTTIPSGVDAGHLYAVSGKKGPVLLYSQGTYKGCERSESKPGPGAIYLLKG